MPPDVVLIEPLPPSIEAELDSLYAVQRIDGPDDLEGVPEALRNSVRAVVTGGGAGVSHRLVEALPALGIVAINGVGTDAVDLDHAKAQGVRVTNTPDVLNDDVADMAILLMLAALRGFVVGDRFVREGRWGKDGLPLAIKATGKRLGIVGLGRIGRAIAKRARAFDMEIAYHGRTERQDAPYRFFPALVDLAAWSDVLVVIAAGGAGTRGLVGKEAIDALGPNGVLVNVARGSVVDEDALVDALTEGRLGAAGLDVFADEPNVPKALLALENVVFQPHRGSATVETRHAMGQLVLDNLAAFFKGEALPTAVA